ncbi:hypothetical protein GPECTOR_32g468 [Gonium pectorale]|uniref:Uncharacterized protein n=1 Tax=Gonium pectorale TaxID=33097 RepID=A0A150GDE5_GONPE|nr:hypothetical protein GPECTOR_32g468 [Gonium pectorale]|eukprot:KXZ47856.1 hypothetical protein GPECTOR_32g468 [Gonium pectorale]
MKPTPKGRYCKVYYSLLALCYFEVLLWTFCLLASCAAPVHGHSYLIRETVSTGLPAPYTGIKAIS